MAVLLSVFVCNDQLKLLLRIPVAVSLSLMGIVGVYAHSSVSSCFCSCSFGASIEA